MHLDDEVLDKIKDFLSKHSLYEFVRELFCRPENWSELKKIGHLNVIKWLHSNVTEKWRTEVYELLVTENALAHLKFLKNNGHHMNISLASFTEACKHGQLQMVQFLDKNNCLYKDSVTPMEAAAENMHSETVKFLHKNGYKCSSLVMEWAAYNNEFHLVDYLNNNDNVLVTKKTITFILDYIGI